MVRLVPNAIAHNNTGLGTANTYSIRGLNNTESIATFDPPVGSYIDDIFIQRQNSNNFALFDVEQTEILRGPQGTLFGRNTTGGAVRVLLKKPAEEFGGYLEAGFGRFDRYNFRGSVDLPVSANVRTKLSAYYIEDDGFVDNITTGESLNAEQNWGVRGAIAVDFSDDLRWHGSFSYIDNEGANVLNADVDGDRQTTTGLVTGALARDHPFFERAFVTGDKANFPANSNETESIIFTSDVEWDTLFGTVNFITGYVSLEQKFNLDFFLRPFDFGQFVITNDGEHDQFSQEIKISGNAFDEKLRYVAGVYYFKEKNETDFADIFTLPFNSTTSNFTVVPPVVVPFSGGFPSTLADRVLENDTEAMAVYAQVDYDLTEQLTLTVGARFTNEEKDVEFNSAGGAGPLTNAGIFAAGIPVEQDEALVTPRFALAYQLTDDFMLFGSATRGFKSGGWNARGTEPAALLDFSAEKVWNFEAGFRSQWLENTLQINVTGFVMDVANYQLPSAFTTITGNIEFITQNFADLDVKGVEAEILWAPVDGLTLFANLGFQAAEYQNLAPGVLLQQQQCINGDILEGETSPPCGQGIIRSDGSIAEPVRAPEYSAIIGGSYVWSITDNMQLIPSITYQRLGEHATGTSNLPGAVNIKGSNMNAGLTLHNISQNWRVSLECKNCTDQDYYVSQLAGLNYLNDPLTWRLSMRYDF